MSSSKKQSWNTVGKHKNKTTPKANWDKSYLNIFNYNTVINFIIMQHPINNDLPLETIKQPQNFPPASPILADFQTIHQSFIYEEDDSTIYTDENGNQHFTILVPADCKHAYWLIRSLQDALCGKVYHARILEPISTRTGEVLHTQDDSKTEPSTKWKATPHNVAIKIMQHSRIRDGVADNPWKEIAVMRYIQEHAAAVSVHVHDHDTNIDDDDNATIDEMRERAEQCMEQHHVMTHIEALNNEQELCIVMPYCDGGEMSNAVPEAGITEPEARGFMLQLLAALDFLQGAELCHRDLGLENIMITSNRQGEPHLVIIDFGMCTRIPYVSTRCRKRRRRCKLRHRYCGKPRYMAPEVLVANENNSVDGHAIDVWALGPILFYMLYGNFPWEYAIATDDSFRLISAGHFGEVADHWDLTWSDDVKALLQGMFRINPTHRLSLEQIRCHPWMNR